MTDTSSSLCVVTFPAGKWINAAEFENSLKQAPSPHLHTGHVVKFVFELDCKIMIDAALRLLSLCNQLDHLHRSVVLDFSQAEDALGYLNRMGFFDHLAPHCDVRPQRPFVSGAALFSGQSNRLVEIHRIDPQKEDRDLPRQITATLMSNCGSRSDAAELEEAAWLVFAELIQNVQAHSETAVDGFAAMQVYRPGGKLRAAVAVSDSGLGIMETLRPALQDREPRLASLSNVDLLVEVFRRGISRHGPERGCGLKGCALKAIKYDADLDLRLPMEHVFLKPSRDQYTPYTAYCSEHLPLLWGTHICFTFAL